MAGTIDSPRQPRNDDKSSLCQLAGPTSSKLDRCSARIARAHYRDARRARNRLITPTSDDRRRAIDLSQKCWIVILIVEEIARACINHAFDLALDLPHDDPDYLAGNLLLGPNVWPELKGFRETISGYYSAVASIGQKICAALEMHLDLPRGELTRQMTKPISQLRLLHYVRARATTTTRRKRKRRSRSRTRTGIGSR